MVEREGFDQALASHGRDGKHRPTSAGWEAVPGANPILEPPRAGAAAEMLTAAFEVAAPSSAPLPLHHRSFRPWRTLSHWGAVRRVHDRRALFFAGFGSSFFI